MSTMEDSFDTPNQSNQGKSTAKFPDIRAGRYEFLDVLGSGGAGVVFKAHDKTLNKTVAIKKLHNSANEKQAARFHREAKLIGSLRHENVMSALDFGLTDKNEPYLVLNFVQGRTLSGWLRKHGPMPLDMALEIFIQIASGLAHAHKKNVIHRDIKPNNVMLVKDPSAITELTAQIVDFGLAKDIEQNQTLTGTGVGLGTPSYMSPEQVRGEVVDHRTDIYSFGCLMYSVIVGHPPFQGATSVDTMSMHLNNEPVPLIQAAKVNNREYASEISVNLQSIIGKCLKKKPEDRYQSFDKLLAELEKELDEPHAPPTVSSSAAVKKTGYLWMIPIVVIVLTMGLYVVFRDQLGDPEPAPTTTTAESRKAELERGVSIEDLENNSPAFGPDKFYLNAKGSYKAALSSDSDFRSFITKTKDIKAMDLVGTYELKPDSLLLLKGQPIQELTLKAGNIEIKNVSELKTLSTLSLHSYDKKVPSLAPLRKLPKLTRLKVTDFKIDSKVLEDVSRIESLKEFHLNRCTGIDYNGLEKLKNSNITILALRSKVPLDAGKALLDLKIKTLDLDKKEHNIPPGLCQRLEMLMNVTYSEPTRAQDLIERSSTKVR